MGCAPRYRRYAAAATHTTGCATRIRRTTNLLASVWWWPSFLRPVLGSRLGHGGPTCIHGGSCSRRARTHTCADTATHASCGRHPAGYRVIYGQHRHVIVLLRLVQKMRRRRRRDARLPRTRRRCPPWSAGRWQPRSPGICVQARAASIWARSSIPIPAALILRGVHISPRKGPRAPRTVHLLLRSRGRKHHTHTYDYWQLTFGHAEISSTEGIGTRRAARVSAGAPCRALRILHALARRFRFSPVAMSVRPRAPALTHAPQPTDGHGAPAHGRRRWRGEYVAMFMNEPDPPGARRCST